MSVQASTVRLRLPLSGSGFYCPDRVNPVQDGVLEVFRSCFGARTLDHHADDTFEVVLLQALRATVQVVLDLCDVCTRERTIQIFIDTLHPGVIAIAQSLAVANFLFSCLLLSAAALDSMSALNPRSAA